MDNKKETTVKSDVEFMKVIGIVIIVLGVLGAIGILTTFDWSTYSDIKSYAYTYSDELSVLKPMMIDAVTMAGATLLVSISIGSFFIAVDKVALNIKKIQLGIKE